MTNKAKHTPGPWVIDNDNVIYQEGTAEPIASAAPTADEKANAALIAAAPELLGALEWALKNIEEIALPEFDKQGRVTSLNNAAERARAAIAKAKGE